MARKILSLISLSIGGGILLAQQQAPVPTFRVTSTRVVVEFIALDKGGRFVNDLGISEIEVEADGKKQDVDFLFPPGAAPQPVPLSLAGTAGQAAPSPDSAAAESGQPADPRLPRTVILLDSRVMDASNFHHSVSAIREFIDESLQADHLVMIAEIDRGLKIRLPFTRDRAELLAAVGSLTPSTVYNPLELALEKRTQSSSQQNEPIASAGSKIQVTQYIDDLQQQINYLRQGLRLLCHTLSAMPGRKNVVFFSEGYPMDPLKQLEFGSRDLSTFHSADERQAASRDVGRLKDPGVLSMVSDIVSLANSFAITFYTVDARGLIGVPGLSADVSGDSEAGAGRGHRNRQPGDRGEVMNTGTFKLTTIGDLANTQNTLLALAGGTNGSAFFNSNDLGAVLRASTLEQLNVYLASFVPSFKKSKRDQFRRIQVKCKRKDVLIRSQAGFLDADMDQLQNQRLALAFSQPEYFRNLSPVIEVSREGGQTQAVIGVPGGQVTARPKDGKFEIEIVFVGRVYDDQGNPVSQKFDIVKGFKLPLDRQQMAALAQQPLLARESLQLKRGKYRLMLAVEDRVSGSLGIGAQEFSVP